MKVILPCCLLWMPGVWAPSPLQQNNQQTDVFHSTRFFEWLAQNGARVDKLRLSSERSLWEGRNTIAAAPVTKGEVVVSVPDNLLMTASLAMARSETARRVHNSGLIPEGTRQHCVIAVYLAEQRTLGPFSVFAPYIEALPHSYSHLPMFFDERDMGLFQAASFRLTVYAQREQLESEFRAVVRAAGALGVPFSRRTFMWARAVVWTRAFNVNPVDQCNAATIALVPMADLINHRAEPNTKWEYNKGLQRFTMTATANIGMGESVHDSYGPKTNSNYFRNFGFTLDNAADEVALVFAPAELTETSMALPGRPGDPPRTPCLSPRERFLFDLNHGHVYVPGKAFVLQFNQGLEAILDYLRGFAPAGVEPQSALALLHAFQLLHGKVTRQIATFPTTKDQDEALLRDASRQPPLSVRHYRAVVIRRGEKRALQYMADVSANAMLSILQQLPRLEQFQMDGRETTHRSGAPAIATGEEADRASFMAPRQRPEATLEMRLDQANAGRDVHTSLVIKHKALKAGGDALVRCDGKVLAWSAATIQKDNGDGTYNIAYAVGGDANALRSESQENVPWTRIEPVTRNSQFKGQRSVWVPLAAGGAAASGISSVAAGSAPNTKDQDHRGAVGSLAQMCPVALGGEYLVNLASACSELEKGDPVYGRWRGGDLFYDGRVIATHQDGTYDLRYNDGDFEAHVRPTLIMCRVEPVRG